MVVQLVVQESRTQVGKFSVWALTFAALTLSYAVASNVGSAGHSQWIASIAIGLALMAVICAGLSFFQRRYDG